MTHVLILFFATFSAAFMATVPPGLLNMNAAKVSVEKGKLNGIIFSLGVSSTIMVQAYIAVYISKFLYRNPEVVDVLFKIAVAVFAFFAIYFFVVAKRNKAKAQAITLFLPLKCSRRAYFGVSVNLKWLLASVW